MRSTSLEDNLTLRLKSFKKPFVRDLVNGIPKMSFAFNIAPPLNPTFKQKCAHSSSSS